MNKLIASLSSAALLCASAAIAEDGMKHDSKAMHMNMMKKMDANSDGMISKTEYMDHHTKMWGKMKKNADGMVMTKDMEMMDAAAMEDDGMSKKDRMKK